MFDSSVIELSKSALRGNIRFLKKQIGKNVRFSSVIKGNAYGHGISSYVPMAEKCGIRHFSVFEASEAYRAWQNRTRSDTEIMIMGFIDNSAIGWAIENDISFYIFDTARLKSAINRAGKIGKAAKIHIEVETGMNRTGLREKYLKQALRLIKANQDYIEIAGLCTHYAGAESIANYKRIQEQIIEFKRLSQVVKEFGVDIPISHSAASAAALTYPETRMNLVRIGIAQFGFWPSLETRMQYLLTKTTGKNMRFADPLKRIMTWKSKVMSIKDVEPGEFVGYGTSYQAINNQKVASIPTGYHHGFSRNLSNLGYVLIRGKRANVVGMVNMNAIMVDVTKIKGVKKGDEVVLIGNQNKNSITVGSFSDLTRNHNYEFLARLPFNIPREVVD